MISHKKRKGETRKKGYFLFPLNDQKLIKSHFLVLPLLKQLVYNILLENSSDKQSIIQ
jgi:hypothetical protein